MIKPPSAHKNYTLIFSGDPALTLPADPEERDRALELARETGNWAPLICEGMTPTLFEFRPLPGTAYDWWLGEMRRRDLSHAEAATLILRLALRKVHNFGAHVVKVAREDGQELATVAIIDAIYAEAGDHGREIIVELSTVVVDRAGNRTPPKS